MCWNDWDQTLEIAVNQIWEEKEGVCQLDSDGGPACRLHRHSLRRLV